MGFVRSGNVTEERFVEEFVIGVRSRGWSVELYSTWMLSSSFSTRQIRPCVLSKRQRFSRISKWKEKKRRARTMLPRHVILRIKVEYHATNVDFQKVG